MVTPGASTGIRTMDCCWCLPASGSVLPMTMATLQRGSPAPEDHHLRQLMTYSSPPAPDTDPGSRRISHWMLVASDEATAGSAIREEERHSPFTQIGHVPWRERG